MKISMELEDGRRWEAIANPKTFNGVASKARFKKEFGLPSIVLSLWGQVLDGNSVDLSQLSADQVGYLDEQHMAFLVWLELRRRCDDVPEGPWDVLVEQIADVELDATEDEDEDGEDPTTAATTT